MKQGSTLFLKAAVILFGLMVLGLCAVVIPSEVLHKEIHPMVIGMYATTVPFYIALYQTMKLLHFVDKNTAFSKASIKALKIIKYCAVSIGAVYAIGLPFFYTVAQNEDAPGVLLIGLILTFTPLVIAGFAAVLQKLLQNAIAIKSENDLTV